MQRLLLPLAWILVIGFASQALSAPVVLSDVRSTPYETAFEYLMGKGAVEGYSDGEGKPNAPLNRVEALKVLLKLKNPDRVAWFTQNLAPLPLFSDVDQRAWYAPYVEAAFEENMVTGYPDSTFKPGRYLTVEEGIAMALRAYGVRGAENGAQLSPFVQNRDHAWFTPYINAAIAKNLVMHQGRLELGQILSRGRFFDIVYRLAMLESTGAVQFTEPAAAPASNTVTAVPQQRIAVPQTQGTSGGVQIRVPQPAVAANTQYSSEKYFSITMPSLGITDLTITHPSDPFTSNGVLAPLQAGVGHLFSYPGTSGKIMIYGHSSSYPWDVSQYTKVFRQVNKLNTGDRIYVTFDGKLFAYEVSHKQTIAASDTAPFRDDGAGEELILYTCWPPDSIAQRYLVHALPVSSIAVR
ncbi:hypothetical protein COU80_00675 [Candidatus Peregrinibacteria bacterium CG10_big_fil_rev_8_21_14_0_10_55_24]|nr:MAG: hypothetical protein COU80_00675 [Candidatus Peregrinibacteria bacterium CG10_big_fil_rev_8_21_14_0_10_55_24]